MATLEGPSRLLTADVFDANNNLIQWVNVSRDTSRFRQNLEVDVALIQFYLFHIYDADRTLVRPVKPITVDGAFGPNTETWVKNFQSHSDIQDRIVPRKFIPVKPDGIVNRAPGNTVQSRLLAIYRLNWAMASLRPSLFKAVIATTQAGALTASVLKTGSFPIPVQI